MIYDVRQKPGADRVNAQRFWPDCRSEPFDPPPRQALPMSAWRIGRSLRSDINTPAQVDQTLEDTPFYVRSVVSLGPVRQAGDIGARDAQRAAPGISAGAVDVALAHAASCVA